MSVLAFREDEGVSRTLYSLEEVARGGRFLSCAAGYEYTNPSRVQVWGSMQRLVVHHIEFS
jgi:hypothetical protein